MKKILSTLFENCEEIYINGVLASEDDIKYLLNGLNSKFQVKAISKVNKKLGLGVE